MALASGWGKDTKVCHKYFQVLHHIWWCLMRYVKNSNLSSTNYPQQFNTYVKINLSWKVCLSTCIQVAYPTSVYTPIFILITLPFTHTTQKKTKVDPTVTYYQMPPMYILQLHIFVDVVFCLDCVFLFYCSPSYFYGAQFLRKECHVL